ncbi:MAG: hypothetical protein K6T65_10200 [Peptococcaceae bacterium]|nr:hypothetical protein [Peptococcaceae bacterium]
MAVWIEQQVSNGNSPKFPEVLLGKILFRRQEAICKESNSLSELNIIAKITFGGDLRLRNNEEKQGYKGPLFKAYPGDLVISKIRVAQGSFCLIPQEMDYIAVSPEYPIYRLDTGKVIPGFLELTLRSRQFLLRLTALASGNTTKQRIRPQSFEGLGIPLPPLEIQASLLNDYIQSLNNASVLERDADNMERTAEVTFEAALGYVRQTLLSNQPMFIARFKNIEQWSHEGMLRASSPAPKTNVFKYPIVTLGEIAQVSYGIQKCPANRPGTHARPYLRVANVQRGFLNLDEIKTINVLDEELPRYQLEDGDLLLCEGNSADLVGRGAIWHNEIPGCVHQNHILRVRVNRSLAIPEFVLAVINSSLGQDYFRAKAKRTTNLASINSREVAEFPLPLPPLNDQQELVSALADARQTAKDKRRKVEQLREEARSNFERSLFVLPDAF